jgi:hypothetical protein
LGGGSVLGEVGAALGPCVPAVGLPVRRRMCGGGELGRRRGPLVLARPAVGAESGAAGGGVAVARSAGGGAAVAWSADGGAAVVRPAGGEKRGRELMRQARERAACGIIWI